MGKGGGGWVEEGGKNEVVWGRVRNVWPLQQGCQAAAELRKGGAIESITRTWPLVSAERAEVQSRGGRLAEFWPEWPRNPRRRPVRTNYRPVDRMSGNERGRAGERMVNCSVSGGVRLRPAPPRTRAIWSRRAAARVRHPRGFLQALTSNFGLVPRHPPCLSFIGSQASTPRAVYGCFAGGARAGEETGGFGSRSPSGVGVRLPGSDGEEEEGAQESKAEGEGKRGKEVFRQATQNGCTRDLL